MSGIVLCGEAVVDFVPARLADGTEAFVCRPGGSAFNTAKAAALAGADAHFMGGVSTDLFGDRLLADLRSAGVGESLVVRLAHPTMLAFVEFLDEQPRYAVLDADTATRNFDPWAIGLDRVEGGVLGVGSAALIYNPSADRIADFTIAASDRSMIVLDPNVRPGLIRDPATWRDRIRRIMGVATIVRLSTEDLSFLDPEVSPREFAEDTLAKGSSCVVVTDGANGSAVGDSIGAGDTLVGAMLTWLLEHGTHTREGIASLKPEELGEMLRFGSASAAINCSRRGCSPATRAEIDEFWS